MESSPSIETFSVSEIVILKLGGNQRSEGLPFVVPFELDSLVVFVRSGWVK